MCGEGVCCVCGEGITAGHPQGQTNYTKLLCNFSRREKCYLLCEETINPPKMILHSPEFHPKEKRKHRESRGRRFLSTSAKMQCEHCCSEDSVYSLLKSSGDSPCVPLAVTQLCREQMGSNRASGNASSGLWLSWE